MADELTDGALRYHRLPRPGKIEVVPTKPLATQRDLSLAYSPGVAAACHEIVRDPAMAAELTIRANLVGVVTNGTAVLGLGAIGPLAAKPVMEGKGVLFKKFAGIDVFDIEIAELDQEKLVDIVAALEPTFGGINLEDIKAPECFYVEQKLRERMKIPVFHDDQHGTAIIVGAAVLNALSLVGKDIRNVKLVVSGAGAAALSCLGVLEKLGLPRENIWVTDIVGVVWKGRNELMDPFKERYARETPLRTLGEVIGGADIFLGLSAAGVLKQDMVKKMAAKPLIFALANPNPEISPEDVAAVRDDAIMATGRSDYPNQVNNVLCFPYIFRGALDVGATTVNDEMKIACVRAIAELARKEPSEVVARAFGEARRRLRPHPDHSQAVRSAPDRRTGAGRREGCDGQRRGDPADRRFRRLPPAAQPVRLQVRPGHAAGVRAGAQRAQAGDLQRRRGRPRVAGRADHPRRGYRPAHPDRASRNHSPSRRTSGPAFPPRHRCRPDRSVERSALRPLLGCLSRADGAARRHRADGTQSRALQPDPDRSACRETGRRRRHDRRRLRPLPHPLQSCAAT